jgi:phage I-like protein
MNTPNAFRLAIPPQGIPSVAALSVELGADAAGHAPKEFRLLPLGRFRAADGSGRPHHIPEGWLLDAASAARLAAQSNARASRRVIDYEHQTLLAADNGKPAPAAGWFGQLEARPDGLYAVDVEWTPAAAAMIAAREYRYISPVFDFDPKTGRVLSIAIAALTNHPGLDGLTDLAGAAALSALFQEEPQPMKTLLAALGLAETATEAEALAALSAMKTTQTAELAALKAAHATPDPARFVEVAALTAVQGELATTRTELAALKAERHRQDVDRVVDEALDAGKLLPATEAWARELGKTNLAALKSYLEAAPVVAKPGTSQSGGAAPAGGAGSASHQPTDVDTAVMKALGLTAVQFAAGKKE